MIPLGLTAAASAADAGIYKFLILTLINSNEEIDGIMKIIKYLEESGLLIKGFSKTIKNKVKELKGGFLSILLCILGASLLKNLLTGKGVKAKTSEQGIIKAGEGTIRAGHDF